MQSFFVASTHFSVQNRRMHEEKTEKTETKMGLLKKIGVVNLVFITLFVIYVTKSVFISSVPNAVF